MFKKLLFALVFLGMGTAHAFEPQSGTWVVTSELNGKPGRGIALDVQNSTLVMQVYAYKASGDATFYLGAGPLGSNGEAALALRSFKDGRYFGSGALTGTEASYAGDVRLRFTSGTTGFATFPGESEVAISRFNFGYAPVPESLLGTWSFTTFTSEGVAADAALLTVITSATSEGNGVVKSADGRYGCEHQTQGSNAGKVLCARVTPGNVFQFGYLFSYSVNDGEGVLLNSAAQPVAASAVFVRRITKSDGTRTGLVTKDAATPATTLGAAPQPAP